MRNKVTTQSARVMAKGTLNHEVGKNFGLRTLVEEREALHRTVAREARRTNKTEARQQAIRKMLDELAVIEALIASGRKYRPGAIDRAPRIADSTPTVRLIIRQD